MNLNNINNDKLLNSYKNRRMEVIYYSRHVFSKSFITRKQMEDFIELIDGLLDDSDELYNLMRQPKQEQPKKKKNYRTLIEVETDIFDELEDRKVEKINKITGNYNEEVIEEETIIDGDILEEEEEEQKDEFEFEEFEPVEDEEEDLKKSSLEVKEIETIEYEDKEE
jgi:hypothetical protein